MKSKLDNFHRYLKKEFAEIQQKLGIVTVNLKTTTEPVDEANIVLSQVLQAQEKIQMKLTDLEAHSSRNNIAFMAPQRQPTAIH